MEQPSKFQHQLQPDKPSSSTMSPSPHPEQTPPWGALWVLALGLAKAVSSSAGGVIGSFRSGDGPAAQFGEEAPKIADAMTPGFIEGNRWTLLVAGCMLLIGLLASVAVRRAASTHSTH